ncbi:autotransporter outer membrane beta-barrel domain-containing protein [Achromobacter ruhlandii]|uniref:S6 family peptidase n=1 Tax=Achromobacter ruhlandii TaxID=72557 RepID=UPI0021F19032|nr:S6 family peptidase [Achromobacter ruhlandii]MCV6798998.1 autotransporter outer membrane beta-barrel domain-containing protein [Achromobacter ruhlandii]
MNKIYALKKNARQQVVPVAEIRRGVKKTSRSRRQRKALALCGVSILACMLAPLPLHASIVGTDLPYQTYRDFSENKGAFQPGATNITLYDKTGVPYAALDRAPMIDFSGVDQKAIATLISPQYVVSVSHNTAYGSVNFGYPDDTLYLFSNRNNDGYTRDFHSPRLIKIVTEVAPMPVTTAGTARGTYQNKNRFPVFYRVGSGYQYVKNRDGTLTNLQGAYQYRTGGTIGSPSISDWSIVSSPGNTYNPAQGPMASYGAPGDSGSPLFAWDAKENRWVLIAVTRTYSEPQGAANSFVVIPVDEFNAVMAKNRDAPVVTQAALGNILWSYDAAQGTGSLTQGDNAWAMHGKHGATITAALDHGKDLTFSGGGTVLLQNSVDQGAGSLTFDDDYTVKPVDNQTWMGAGIFVNDNHVVDWGINGVRADSLHKLGTGTLTINGVGVNPGELSVGDGTVMLSQRADADGKVQAFDAIHIASGRPTVVLGDAGQVNPDNVRWGYRGGQLDVNGNNITVHRLNGADKGAVLTNRGPQATLNLDFNRTDTAATDTAAIANIWHGHFTGNLDVVNRVEPGTKNDFVIDGGTRLAGALHQSNGRLFLQGHPVVHAVNQKPIATKLSRTGDNSALTQPVSFKQDDWETRHFEMESLVLTDAGLHLGRNATLAANILARNSRVTLGSDELYIDLEDGNGVKTRPVLGKSKALVQADQSRFEGRVRLTDQSKLDINQQFAGGIDAIDSAIRVASTQAELTQPSEFTRSSLALADNARLTSRANLNSDGSVQVGAGAVLSMQAAPHAAASRTTYSAASWRLQGAHGALEAGAGILLLGDIFADDDASVSLLGGGDFVAPGSAATLYTGAVTAGQAAMRMHENSHWFITGDSAVNRLQADNALLSFGGNSRAEGVLPPQTDSGDTLAMREIQATSVPPSSVLTVDTLAASDSVFVFRADPYSGAHDQMTVTTLLSGSGNRLRAAYAGDEPAGEPVQARETLLISAPALTDANLFTPETYFVRNDASDIPAQTDPWRSGLAVSHDADQRQWWLISMSDAAPWRLTESREFDLLHLPSEERVELSQPGPAWTPHELRVDTLIASGVRFAMTARPQSHESDSIHIASLAQGDDNRLDLTLLVNDPVPADDSGALLLATAPAATLDSYFKPGSVTQGLTLYVPNLEIVSTDTEKKWQLAYRAVERPVEPPVEKPADPPVEKPADPPAEKPAAPPAEKPDDPPAEKPADPPAEKPADPPVEKPADPPVEKPAEPPAGNPMDKPDAPVETGRPNTGGLSLFTPYSLRLSELSTLRSRGEIINRLRQNGIAADDDIVNQVNAVRQQVNRTAVLASLPKVAFVLETNQLNKRLGDVRQLHEEAGLWIKTSHGQADYQQVHLKHNTLQLGLDRKQGMHLYGVMGSYTQGSGQGDEGLSEKHTTGGIGVYYAMINEDGPFIDVIAKYLRTNHTYQMPANLRIEGHGAQSTSLLASVQAGWRLNLLNDRAFVEPSVEVVTGYTSAYTLHGDESSVDVRVNASTPVYAKIGAAAGLNFQSDEQRGVTLSAGLFRLQNLRRGGGIDVLNNSVRGDMLSTPMADDSRYLVNVSLNARLSPNWRFYSQVESSFAGKLKHDYSGQIGVRYQF